MVQGEAENREGRKWFRVVQGASERASERTNEQGKEEAADE